MSHKYLVIGLILLISTISITSTTGKILQEQNPISFFNNNLEEKTNNNFIDNITLQDDALHKTYNSSHIETWYFDSYFKNNYSVAFVITMGQRNNNGLVMVSLSLYKDAKLISFSREMYLFSKMIISEEKLYIKLNDKMLVTGDIDSVSDCWVYDVFLEIDDQVIDLHFVSITKGWRVDIRDGWWLVVPRLNATGWLIIDGENISVSGEGYHDHNWHYIFSPLIQKGWYWGNFNVDSSLSITWAEIKKNYISPLDATVVINPTGMNSYLINPEDVTFSVSGYMFDHGRVIPKTFFLKINSWPLYIDVRMDTLDTHFIKHSFIKYWRYHMRVVGIIVYDGIVKEVNTIQIADILRIT